MPLDTFANATDGSGHGQRGAGTLVLRLLVPTLTVLVVAMTAWPAMSPLRVVPQMDYARYAGTWFELARLPFRYERDCVSDVTASYAPRPDGRITVTNRCLLANGTFREAEGVARRVDGQPPSVLKVRFAPAFLSFLPMVWGDYQVIALDPDYQYALVGTPDRAYLWLLSRATSMDPTLYSELMGQARLQGFDVAPLIKTQHTQSTPR